MNSSNAISPCPLPPPCCPPACIPTCPPDCIPPCPVLCEQTLEKNQVPVCDTFGPFPDETLMANLDRILFLLGAQRIQKLLHLPTPCLDVCPSAESCGGGGGGCCDMICSLPCCKKSTPSTCCSATTTPIASKYKLLESLMNKGGKTCISPRKPLQPLKRSFSMCSLACRKLKQVCFNGPKGCCGGDPTPKWLWSRLHCFKDGCEVYEIFKQSCICSHPSQIKVHSNPKVIFVVLPNGVVMPFETLSSH